MQGPCRNAGFNLAINIKTQACKVLTIFLQVFFAQMTATKTATTVITNLNYFSFKIR